MPLLIDVYFFLAPHSTAIFGIGAVCYTIEEETNAEANGSNAKDACKAAWKLQPELTWIGMTSIFRSSDSSKTNGPKIRKLLRRTPSNKDCPHGTFGQAVGIWWRTLVIVGALGIKLEDLILRKMENMPNCAKLCPLRGQVVTRTKSIEKGRCPKKKASRLSRQSKQIKQVQVPSISILHLSCTMATDDIRHCSLGSVSQPTAGCPNAPKVPSIARSKA